MKVFQVPMLAMSLVGLGLLSGLDAPPARADFTFGQPVNIQSDFPFLDPATEWITCFSADGLEVYGISFGNRPGAYGLGDLWVCKRASPEDDWGLPENLGATINSASQDGFPFLAADGLELYFWSGRDGGYGAQDLYVTRRATRTSPWGVPTNLGQPVNTSQQESVPVVSPDGLELYFSSTRPGGYGGFDVYVTRRATANDPWGEAENLGPAVNSPGNESASLSPDGLLMFLTSDRPGGFGPWGDGYMAKRASRSAPWQPAVNLGPVVNRTVYNGPIMSADGSTLYIMCDPNDDMTTWTYKAPILPIVDFNGDEKVDIKDLLRLIESWGKYDPAVDIGPTPFGDGIVDEKDLEVLMSYWGKEVLNPALGSYWRLDEAEGVVATDCVGGHDGTLVGSPVWLPEGGRVGGALQLDGKEDYGKTDPIMNPATKVQAAGFSVSAWVKGGGPGQAIISQADGVNWLSTDSSQGRLTTDLKVPGRTTVRSQTAITDGNWHHVGVSVEGSTLRLYLDDVEVAKDTQTQVASKNTGLYFGAGKNLEASSFWSGLIDDVRIYDRVVKP